MVPTYFPGMLALGKRFLRLDPSFPKPSAAKVFAAALIVKLVLGCMLTGNDWKRWSDRFQSSKAYDDIEYYQLGCRLLEAHTFAVTGPSGTLRPTVYRTPGYPGILAAFVAIVGKSPLALLLVQAVVLSAIPVLFLFILREMHLRLEWAWLFVLDPLVNILSLTFMTEGWLVLLLLLSLFCWLRADRLSWRFASFLWFILALLIKPSGQFFFPLFLGVTLVHFQRRAWTILFGIVSTAPILLWMARNCAVTGEFRLSTQTDAQIMAVETIKAKERGIPDREVLEWIVQDWKREHGEDIFERIEDNKLDFVGVMSGYAIAHPFEFARYHLAGMGRVLFGTARNHIVSVFRNGQSLSPLAGRAYDLFMLAWYAVLYAAVAWRFRVSWLKHPVGQFCLLFILYNLMLIGVLAYTTGGGLKRMPFLFLIYLLLAFSFVPLAPGDKPLLLALLRKARGG